jgi:UDP-galactopyranose mutase
MQYDFVIVGAGLFGATLAHLIQHCGKRCIVIEKRSHIAGNIYTEEIEGIPVHRYGAHIFHTSDEQVWNFITRFGAFNNYINSPIALYQGKLYNLPFNMNTFYQMWGVTKPDEAKKIIEQQRKAHYVAEPKNLEEQAINLVGIEIYERLIKGYTEKQWGRPCAELPPEIITRLPVRYVFNNNYFNARYQGVPTEGYTALVASMLQNVEVVLNHDFLIDREYWLDKTERVIYTGPIDAYFNYQYGPLEYRSLRFETEVLETDNYQGNAVVNYTEKEVPYTRIIEHKHFVFGQQPKTVITREYSTTWQVGDEPFYPVANTQNQALYKRYRALADHTPKVIFGGRLGAYKYYDMDQVIAQAFSVALSLGIPLA